MLQRLSIGRVPTALVLVFVVFVILGLPDGVLGTVWPSQRVDLGRSIGDLSWIVTALTLGYLVATTASGHLTQRWGASSTIVAGLAGTAVGLIGFGLAPNFGALLVISAFSGATVGLLDAVVNAWLTVAHGAAAMGFLHAFFGVGATLGAPLTASGLDAGLTWRSIFVIIGVGELVVLGLVWARRRDFDAALPPAEDESPSDGTRTVLLPMMLVWFFIIVGIEVAVGAWAFSLLVEVRGVGATVAALWVASFWGAFTAVRFIMGLLGERLAPLPTLAVSVAMTGVGAGLLWADPAFLPAGAPLPLLGIGASLLFPMMVLVTPRWLGSGRAGIAVGYQFAAASLGALAFAVFVGQLAERWDLEVLGPVLFAAAVTLALLLGFMARAARTGARVASIDGG